jgi:hypothetical protein
MSLRAPLGFRKAIEEQCKKNGMSRTNVILSLVYLGILHQKGPLLLPSNKVWDDLQKAG